MGTTTPKPRAIRIQPAGLSVASDTSISGLFVSSSGAKGDSNNPMTIVAALAMTPPTRPALIHFRLRPIPILPAILYTPKRMALTRARIRRGLPSPAQRTPTSLASTRPSRRLTRIPWPNAARRVNRKRTATGRAMPQGTATVSSGRTLLVLIPLSRIIYPHP